MFSLPTRRQFIRRAVLAALFGVMAAIAWSKEWTLAAGLAVVCFMWLLGRTVHHLVAHGKYTKLISMHAQLRKVMLRRSKMRHVVYQDPESGMVFYTSFRDSSAPFSRSKQCYTWGIRYRDAKPGWANVVCYEHSSRTSEITRLQSSPSKGGVFIEVSDDGGLRLSRMPRPERRDMEHYCRLSDPAQLEEFEYYLASLVKRLGRAHQNRIGSKASFRPKPPQGQPD